MDQILFENEDMLAVNKPPRKTTEAVVAGQGGVFAVHRLDKDTSGVLVLAKTEEVLARLQAEFKARRVQKEYLALVYGILKDKEGEIDQPLKRSTRYPMRRTVHPEGKPAVTEWKVEEEFTPSPSALAGHSPSGRGRKYSLLRLFPLTGRTHQLRAHLHWLGHPIVGDKLYKFRKHEELESAPRQLLHAEKLTLQQAQGKHILDRTFQAPMPDDFNKTLDDLRKNYR